MQNSMADAELSVLMNIKNKICTPQNNAPVAGLVQDSLVGLYFLSRKNERVDLDLFYDCLFTLNKTDTQKLYKRVARYYKSEFVRTKDKRIKPKYNSLPGRILLSVLFPEDFYYSKKTHDEDEVVDGQDPYVKIENGVLVCGDLIKSVLGAKSGSIVHVLFIEYNADVACDFISNAQFLCHRWFPSHSFSFGISDCLNHKDDEIQKTLKDTYTKCDEILGCSEEDVEQTLITQLNNASAIGQKLSKEGMNKGINNAMVVCTYSGAKGDYVNCSQISAYLGQQNIMGKRVEKRISNGTRTLPHFDFNENTPESRGFIDKSFIKGLTPTQYFFHAQSGREGLMDTAVKTQDSGYIQRRFVKKMENFKIHVDSTIRDSNGSIVSFLYGANGFNPKHLYSVSDINKEPFYIDIERFANRINSVYEMKVVPSKRVKKIKLGEKQMDVVLMEIKPLGHTIHTDVLKCVQKNIHNRLINMMKKIEIYYDKDTVMNFIHQIHNRYAKALAEPGDMVGIVAACSLGESATQATLNSFHSAGKSSKAVTTGVPRLEEILAATKNPKTPSMSVYINTPEMEELKNEPKRKTLAYLDSLKSHFEYTLLNDVASSIEVMKRDEDVQTNAIPVFASRVKIFNPKAMWWCGTNVSENIIVIKLDCQRLFELRLTTHDIVKIFHNDDNFNSYTCYASPNCKDPTIVVYPNFDVVNDKFEKCLNVNKSKLVNKNNYKYYYTRDVLLDKLKNIRICGINGIEKIFPIEGDDGWFLDVQGSNLNQVVNVDIVDSTKTISDNMWEIYERFGIEATRAFLVDEVRKTLCGEGSYINPAHFMLLSDSITRTGTIKSVSRNGISRSVGPFTKAAFEEPINNFIKSTLFGEVDDLNSVSSGISFGKVCNIGTSCGYFELKNKKI